MQMREGEGAGGGAGMATGSAFHVEIIVRGQYISRVSFSINEVQFGLS